jgi:hypothetical protein
VLQDAISAAEADAAGSPSSSAGNVATEESRLQMRQHALIATMVVELRDEVHKMKEERTAAAPVDTMMPKAMVQALQAPAPIQPYANPVFIR